MTLKLYLWGLRIIFFLALVGWALVIFYIDPESQGILGQLFFYSSLFTAIAAFLILVLTKFRVDPEDEEKAGNLAMSFRQGILLALLVIVLLVLQNFRVLVWWDGLLAVAAIFLVELYFLSRE